MRLVPLLRRFGLSLDRYRSEVRALAGRGYAPRPIRERIASVLLGALDQAPVAALVRFVEALFVHDWPGALTRAIAGALAMGDQSLAFEFVAAQPYARPMVAALARRGVIDDELVASVALADVLEPSIPLLKGMTDLDAAERVASRMPPRFRSVAQALLARLEPTRRAAENRVRAIREESTQCFARLALSRAAVNIDDARVWASTIVRSLPAERARLDIARRFVALGQYRDALHELKHVKDRRLWAENMLTRCEIRFTEGRMPIRGNRDRESAWDAPTWASGGPDVPVDTRARVLYAVWLLVVDDTGSSVDHALSRLREHIALRDRFAELVIQRRIDVNRLVVLSRDPRNARVLDALQCALIARRADVLACCADVVLDHDRASLDEAVALSSDAPRRRRVLIGAAQACVRSAMASPERWDPAVVETRLRTLVHLGGELGVGAIRTALSTQPVGRFSKAALEALCVADPRAAAELLLNRQPEWAASRIDVAELLQLVEVHHGLRRGFALAYRAAQRAVLLRSPMSEPEGWLQQFFALWRARFGILPEPDILQGIADRERLPESPVELFHELDIAVASLERTDHFATFDALRRSDALLGAALIAAPARVDATRRTWTLGAWKDHLQILEDDEFRLCEDTMREVAKRLGCPIALLRRGDLAALGVPVYSELEDGFRLRLLDKRIDLLTYLRFADVKARSCYHSDGDHWYWSADAVANVWRDPLAMTFHIEKSTSLGWHACGFLFGSFVELRDGLGVVFNSVHVRPNRDTLRAAVLETVERIVGKALGLRAIGIANCHGGYGVLPKSYERRGVKMRRFRALRQLGALLTRGDDDIGACNATVRATHLWWRDLE